MPNISRQYPRSEAEILGNLDRIEALICRQRETLTYRERTKLMRELESARASERLRLRSKLGLRPLPILGSPRNWSVASLEQRAIWCELCGSACGRLDADHGLGFQHCEGFSKAGEARQLHTVLIHTRWHFDYVDTFAREFNMSARFVGWSWYGPEYIAALVSKRIKQ